jgi:galactokinase
MTGSTFIAHAPGRVNLIGDHTDYAGGLALPCAIDLGITLRGVFDNELITLTSDALDGEVAFAIGDDFPIESVTPTWGRYVAAVARESNAGRGFRAEMTSTLPVGSGLSSSAALEISVALALQFDGTPMRLAELGQRAEVRAVGVPCGLLDQLSIVFGKEHHALLIDFSDLSIVEVPIPEELEIVVIHSGEERQLATSHYSERRRSCEAAAAIVGPLALASIDDLAGLDDSLRKRARHVVSECERVRCAAEALRTNDVKLMGALMTQSHVSLRDDFEVSTPALDQLVAALEKIPGVYGARLTGAGFGGCVVALCERGAIGDPTAFSGRGWRVQASEGARLVIND